MNEFTVIDITGATHIIKAERYEFVADISLNGKNAKESVVFYTALDSVVARFYTDRIIGIIKGVTA